MWCFVDSGARSASWNMALDEVFANRVRGDKALAVVRIYGWDPWAVTIGYGQSAGQDFNLSKIQEAGYDFVRRSTGGRAVLHANEITYSVIARTDHEKLGGNLHETYRIIGNAILDSLRSAGFADLEIERSKPLDRVARNEVAKPCFSSTARYEITWRGKKVAGSAQKRAKDVVQQHGSILLGDEYLGLVDFMNLDQEAREAFLRSLRENAISLSTIAAKPIGYEDVAKVFARGFEAVFGEPFGEFPISKEMLRETEELAAQKFSSMEWNEERKTAPASA